MVAYAKASSKVETVDTTTNAILLTPELNLKMVEAGIDRINISVNGVNAEQYKNFTGYDIDFDKYVANIKHLYENRGNTYIFIKINGDTISKEDQDLFLSIFEPLADSVAIERSFECWEGFKSEGFVSKEDGVGIYGQKIEKEVLVCPYVQYSFTINSDGKVSLCFLDWSRKLIIGDVKSDSVKSIWDGKIFNNFQDLMLNKERKSLYYCSSCNQLKGGNPSDIDDYADDILYKRSLR
jgi:radical SAM protein with 4Fe4S-binding SPASM domain